MLADINGNLADLRSEAMASQRFCLRWNNHQSNLLSVFDQLLHDEAFVDVTLAVEGQLLRAHKMVLSACSPYFQALFVGHPDKHPIVILKDVPYVDMRSLLDFMYRGEVSVDQDRLTAFLRVAESLRIKGLTEVNEDKCDLPSITSSLLSNQNTVPPPPPNLHRINQIGSHHHISQKRFHHMSSHPLLGSALTAPKRKRGRPRKLSGSSDTPLESMGQDHHSSSELVQGSPEMMEMKMGLDFQGDVSASGAGSNGSTNNGATSTPNSANLAALSRQDEPTENGTDIPDSITKRIKREPEPTPSTSAQATEETFARPQSRQGSEGFKQDFASSQSSNSSKSDMSESWKEKSRNLSTPPSSQSSPDLTKTPTTISASNNNAPSTSSSTNTTNTSSTRTSSSPATGRANTPNSPAAQNSPGAGTMSAPQSRQVAKRRMRRRATSQSQDPAEQLTEMSVRDQLPNLPSDITFEICTSPTSRDDQFSDASGPFIKAESVSGMHFLTDREDDDQGEQGGDQGDHLSKSETSDGEPEVRKQLLEYLPQNDGSVVCKWCGEVISNRQRWYRHKYKLHVPTQVTQPAAPIFKCNSCNTFFKSRKGYIGHLSSRHSDYENDENREDLGYKKTRTRNLEIARGPDWEQQREKEEKLVADIIDRVKRECEAQGETVSRRGYSRRTTVMNS